MFSSSETSPLLVFLRQGFSDWRQSVLHRASRLTSQDHSHDYSAICRAFYVDENPLLSVTIGIRPSILISLHFVEHLLAHQACQHGWMIGHLPILFWVFDNIFFRFRFILLGSGGNYSCVTPAKRRAWEADVAHRVRCCTQLGIVEHGVGGLSVCTEVGPTPN